MTAPFTHPYLPTSGRIEYACLAITGILDEPNRWLSVSSRRACGLPGDLYPPRLSICAIDFMPAMPWVSHVNAATGQPPLPQAQWSNTNHKPDGTPDPIGAALFHGAWPAVNGLPAYIGEMGGPGTIGGRAICKLPMLPVSGQVFNGIVEISGMGGYLDTMPWAYKTHYVGTAWGPWPDTVVTTAIERPGTVGIGHNAFSYAFARNVGIIDMWYITSIGANGIASGYELYATSPTP